MWTSRPDIRLITLYPPALGAGIDRIPEDAMDKEPNEATAEAGTEPENRWSGPEDT